jgi:2,4-dienoyl-CoA reductase (NADPH2)
VALAPDTVVVATGGRTVVPELPGSELPHVRRGIPLDDVPPGRRVAIVGTSLAAVQLAELLATQDRLVSLLADGDLLAPEVGWKRRTEHMDRLDRLGVAVNVGVSVERLDEAGVVFSADGRSERLLPSDAVVLTGEVQPDLSLHDALAGRVPELHAVGDCTGLALIRGAVEQGARAAWAI